METAIDNSYGEYIPDFFRKFNDFLIHESLQNTQSNKLMEIIVWLKVPVVLRHWKQTYSSLIFIQIEQNNTFESSNTEIGIRIKPDIRSNYETGMEWNPIMKFSFHFYSTFNCHHLIRVGVLLPRNIRIRRRATPPPPIQDGRRCRRSYYEARQTPSPPIVLRRESA